MSLQTKTIQVEGMQCSGCEDIIRQAVAALPGVHKAEASYTRQCLEVVFDDELSNRSIIEQAIVAKGYAIKQPPAKSSFRLRHLLWFVLLLAMVGGVAFWGKTQMPAVMQLIQPHMDHLLLFGIGFLTGFHCIGMCGGFVVSYTDASHAKWRQMLSHLSYGFGKTFSYAAIGALSGLLGSAIAFTPQLRGWLALAASVFLILFGLRMLNIFSALRHFILRLPAAATQEINQALRKRRNPLITGLLGGLLLGCGPLQAMYIMAAGTGDPLQGAMILALFGAGTLLPLWGFGLFATLLSAGAMRQLVKVSGLLVLIMGMMMAQRGLMMLKGGQMPMTAAPQHHTSTTQ